MNGLATLSLVLGLYSFALPIDQSLVEGKADSDIVTTSQISQADSIVKNNDSLARADFRKQDSLQTLIQTLGQRDESKIISLQARLDSIKNEESLRRERQSNSIDSLKKTVQAYPVLLSNDTLFFIYLRLGSFSAKDRAEAIAVRIKKIGESAGFDANSIVSYPSENSMDILYQESILMSITDNDALWFNTTKEDLAELCVGKIRQALVSYRKLHSLTQRIYWVLEIVLVIALLSAFVFGVRRGFRWVRLKTLMLRSIRPKGLSLKNIELLSPKQELSIILSALRACEFLSYGLALYRCLPLLFAVIPSTREWSGKLIDLVLVPLKSIFWGALGFLPNLLNILVIFAVTHYGLKIARKIFDAIEKETLKIEGFYSDWARPTYNICRILVYALMFIAIFPLLPGSNSPIFRGVSVFLGVL